MHRRITRLAGCAVAVTALTLTAAPAASAHAASHRHASLGATTVTTAPGIATTFVKAGVLPLPVLPRTRIGLSLRHGLQVSYGFPITRNTADLATATGDIRHAGGILFVSRSASLEIGRFDIDLAAGKVFARQVNHAPAHLAVLDLDLAGLHVHKGRHGRTVLTGIGLNLDPAAATALNATFGLSLPTDGSLRFGAARIVLRG